MKEFSSQKALSFTESVIRDMTRVCIRHKGVNLAQGFPDFAAPEEIKEAAVRAIREDYNQYAITWGTPNLRQAIAQKFARYNGVKMDPEKEVTVCCGATEGMIASLMAIGNPGEEVIVVHAETHSRDGVDHRNGLHPCVLGSRILGGYAIEGGMPVWKYVANRLLTAAQNLLCGAKLSEYHTGYRAFRREVLEALPLLENSDDFVFDNQMLAQILVAGYEIGEVSCPAANFEEASSINFRRSVRYGLGVLLTSLQAFLQRKGLVRFRIFDPQGRRLDPDVIADHVSFASTG